MECMNQYSCSRCHQRAHSLAGLFRHFCTWHGTENNWPCNLEGCTRTYRLYSSYRKHVSRCHEHLFPGRVGSAAPTAEPNDETNEETSEPSMPDEPAVDVNSVDVNAGDQSHQCALQLSSLLLKWQEGRQLPESTANEIANDVITFATKFCSSDTSKLESLRTKTGRENHWKSLHGFVSPRTVPCSNQAHETYEYVPILETIAAVAAVRDLFKKAGVGSSALLQDVADGTYFQQHSILKNASTESLLALQLYFDEFEVCNPLGSKRGKHKVLAGYLTILNSSPKSRSKLSDKYLVLLVKTSLVKKFGLQQVLKPVLVDIQSLETSGIELNGVVVKGSLLYVCGDNLSSHQLGAFRECFSSGPICRFCMATKSEINEKWREHEFTLRTRHMHARHVELTQTDPSLSSIYGVAGKSCLTALESFDVTQGLPPDIMHDVFEGVIPFVMKHVVKHLITNRVITLDELNERLSSFPFQGSDKKSRLPPLSRQAVLGSVAIKGSAAEKLCFFRYFSLLVGDCVSRDNAAYKVYLSLRAVVDIVAAPQVCHSTAGLLQALTEDFYGEFKEVFPDISIIPKMHYLIHYPRLLLLYGPLSRLSCMRFEAKHQFFKSIARKVRNFKNICVTLSRRHQMQLLYTLSQPEESMVTVGSRRTDQASLPSLLKDRLQELCLVDMEVECVTSVTLSERKLDVGCVVPLIVLKDELPQFAQVSLIAICDAKQFVVASILDTRHFDEHFHAFVVDYTGHSVIIEDVGHNGEFFDPLYLYKQRGYLYVSPRYVLFSESEH